MFKKHTLECSVAFIGEKRSKMYGWYALRAPQPKNLLGAKSPQSTGSHAAWGVREVCVY